jgi:co-chaperonin GroES (HSP10)
MDEYKVRGYRILIQKEEVKRQTEWGFQLSAEGTYNDRLENSGYNVGRVMDIGHTCWKGSSVQDEAPWCAVGDLIVYSKHAERKIPALNADNHDDSVLYVINDDDVICVIEEKE